MKMKYLSAVVLLCSVWTSGCATNYYPLKNTNYFDKQEGRGKKVVVLPFDVNLQYYYSTLNTAEKAKAKAKIARGFVIDALRAEMPEIGYQVLDYVPSEWFEEDDLHDKELLHIVNELLGEYANASYAFQRNLKEDKGKPFDYSIGVRVQELNKKFTQKPDLYLILLVNGYVLNLTILEDNALNTTAAILSLGMSKLFVGSDDATGMDMIFIDAETGDIVWVNYKVQAGRSILLYEHIRQIVEQLLNDFSKTDKEKL